MHIGGFLKSRFTEEWPSIADAPHPSSPDLGYPLTEQEAALFVWNNRLELPGLEVCTSSWCKASFLRVFLHKKLVS